MSQCSANKRLAVLEAVFERDLSVRNAARMYGVNKNSVCTWMLWHRTGKLTLEALRSRGITPAKPVELHKELHKESYVAEAWELVKQSTKLRESLLKEREEIVKELSLIDEALRILAE